MTEDSTSAAVIEAMLAIVLGQHGGRLSAEQIDTVRQAVADLAAAGERLGQFPLDNSDEPVFIFMPVEG